MHHTISYHLAQARIAALRQHAQRGAQGLGPGRRRPGAVPGIAQAAQPAAASDASAR